MSGFPSPGVARAWLLDVASMAAWMVGAALVLLGSPASGLAADLLAWTLFSMKAPKRSWPRGAQAVMLVMVLLLAVIGSVRWLTQVSLAG